MLESSGCPSSLVGSSKGKATKRNSDVRKEQNRTASRAYRERRRQRLAQLAAEVSADASPTQTPSSSSQADQSASLACEDLSFDNPWPVPLNDSLSDYVLLRATVASNPMPDDVALGMSLNPPQEHALRSFGQGQPQGQPQGHSSSEAFVPRHTASSYSALGNLLQLLDEQPARHDLARSVVSADRSRQPPTNRETSARDESLGALLDHLRTLRAPTVQRALYVRQNSLFAAVMDNTLAIGCLQGMQLMFSDDGGSPFNKHWADDAMSAGSRRQLLLSQIRSQFAATPKDLQPVDEQITMAHHIYLDVFPFPRFRQRALQALAQDPPLFDEDELCVDITRENGMVNWGSLGNGQGMEACRPWDMRSWEPQPWFLRKYWFLVGGWEDDMWKASRWWHAVRNERIGAAGSPQKTKM